MSSSTSGYCILSMCLYTPVKQGRERFKGSESFVKLYFAQPNPRINFSSPTKPGSVGFGGPERLGGMEFRDSELRGEICFSLVRSRYYGPSVAAAQSTGSISSPPPPLVFRKTKQRAMTMPKQCKHFLSLQLITNEEERGRQVSVRMNDTTALCHVLCKNSCYRKEIRTRSRCSR